MRGTAHTGTGNIERYADALLDHVREADLASPSVERDPQAISICLTNHSSFLSTLLFARPKRIVWTFAQNGESVTISTSVFLHRWYVVVILVACLAWSPLLVLAFLCSSPVLASLLILLALGLLCFPFYLLNAEYGHRMHVAWEAMHGVARKADEALVETCIPRISSHVWHLLSYLAHVIAILLALGVWNYVSFIRAFTEFVPLALIVIGGVLVILSLAILLRRHVRLRVGPMLPGFFSMLGMLSLLFAVVVWSIPAGRFTDEDTSILAIASATLNDPSSSPLPQHKIVRLSQHIKDLRHVVLGSVVLWSGIIGVGIGCLLHAARVSKLTAPGTARLSLFSGRSRSLAKAASGGSFLPAFRLFLGGAWLAFGGLLLFGIAVAGMGCVSAVAGPEHLTVLPTSRWVFVSARLLAFAVTGTPESPVANASVRIVWFCGCGLFLSVAVVSVSQLVRQQRKNCHDRLQRATEDDRVSEIVGELASLFRMKPPRICIADTKDIGAWACEHGLFHRRQFIEITSGAIAQERLTPGFLRFAIGHELAHLRLHHVTWLNWLRWFGRLTFVGDTFVFTLVNSWEYERTADRYVFRNANIPAYVIHGCLEILEQQALRERGDEMIEYTDVASQGAVGLGNSKTYTQAGKDSFRAFVRQYTKPFDHAYWHPSIKDRIEAAREFTKP
ncbi:MAG: M48 family metalloprotease [Candidatus Nealsonbacteria bacterium]|nr:M48 family metalloprotease [Candidatus Nealsonbacteria bacterium]